MNVRVMTASENNLHANKITLFCCRMACYTERLVLSQSNSQVYVCQILDPFTKKTSLLLRSKGIKNFKIQFILCDFGCAIKYKQLSISHCR